MLCRVWWRERTGWAWQTLATSSQEAPYSMAKAASLIISPAPCRETRSSVWFSRSVNSNSFTWSVTTINFPASYFTCRVITIKTNTANLATSFRHLSLWWRGNDCLRKNSPLLRIMSIFFTFFLRLSSKFKGGVWDTFRNMKQKRNCARNWEL